MDNSTIIFIILIVFFFLKKTRKYSFNTKKENFVREKKMRYNKEVNKKRKIKKAQESLRNKISERKNMPKIKFDKNINLKTTRLADQKSKERKCYNKYSKLAMADKTEEYIKKELPIYCNKIFKKIKNRHKNNFCEAPEKTAKTNYFKTMQPVVYVMPSYEIQKLSDNSHLEDYRKQFNSLYVDWNNNNNKIVKGIKIKDTKLKSSKNKNNYIKNISYSDQFNINFNYDISFGNQFDSILNY